MAATASGEQAQRLVAEHEDTKAPGRTVEAEYVIAPIMDARMDKAKRGADAQTRRLCASSDRRTGGGSSLPAFAVYSKGSLAPWWLLRGVCDAWGFDTFTTEVRLLAASENSTFLVLHNDNPYGVVHVSRPEYAGGPIASASEIAWLGALHSVKEVHIVDDIPTASGFTVATVVDEEGVEWSCTCMAFVEGKALEELPDLISYYRTLGRWTALFHIHSRSWQKPDGFERFEWNLADMVGEHPRWGRWEDAVLSPGEFNLLKHAEQVALDMMDHVPLTKDTWGLVHADLRPVNVIVDADGMPTVVDFDNCGYSYFLYDYAAALSFVEHEPDASSRAKEWMAGYQEITLLSGEDFLEASALSMIRRLQMFGWTVNHYADMLPEGLFDAQGPGTLYCAERYLENPLWLLDEGA